MSSDQINRDELIFSVHEQIRRSGALAVLLSQAVAESIGQSSTDIEALDLLVLNGPITAGRLSELTGLSTGAITGIADRLERSGLVRREPDPNDRRRVILRALPARIESEIVPLYRELAEEMRVLFERYNDEQLALFLDLLTRSYEITVGHIAKLKSDSVSSRRVTTDSKQRREPL